MMDGSELEGRIKNFDRFALILDQRRHRSHDLQARDRHDQDAEGRLQLLLASVGRRDVTSAALHARHRHRPRQRRHRRAAGCRGLRRRRAATRSATSPARVPLQLPTLRVARPWPRRRDRRQSAAAAIAARRVRPHGGSVGREGLGHRPLGDDGHRARSRRSRRFPTGFAPEIIAEFARRTGRGVLGNKAASGTEIIDELGAEHMRTGALIVYTSADSVFQIAAHEDVVPDRRAVSRLRDRLRAGRRRARRRPRDRAAVRRRARRSSRAPSNRHDYALPPFGRDAARSR